MYHLAWSFGVNALLDDYPKSSTITIEEGLGAFTENYFTNDSMVNGFYASDILTIGGAAVRQVVGVATSAGSGDPPGGILGIGLSSDESIVNQGGKAFPGYIDTMVQKGLIKTRAYSIYFEDESKSKNRNTHLTAANSRKLPLIKILAPLSSGGMTRQNGLGSSCPFPLSSLLPMVNIAWTS